MERNILLRVALPDDIEALYNLAKAGGKGLTNLPPDKKVLLTKLESSQDAIHSESARKTGAAILFIVEMDNYIVGTSCVFPNVGASWPFYSYRITRQASKSIAIGQTSEQRLLNLVNDFDGEAEVGGLFIDPSKRGHALGKLAAKARYMFIASHRDWFNHKVIAELRGWQDENGNSPLWEALGKKFYNMDFEEADRLCGLSGNQFIADLGPRYPIYISLLPNEAKQVLGRPHNDGKRALEMLKEEGFLTGEYVDIFDGGPTVTANIDHVKTIRDSKEISIHDIGKTSELALVTSGKGEKFRASIGGLNSDGTIDPNLAQRLKVNEGCIVRYINV